MLVLGNSPNTTARGTLNPAKCCLQCATIASAVVAKPDARWGETPCAFVELKADAQVTAEQIVAHCKQHLAGFKVPRAVVFGELPKTSTGKIQKFE